MVELQTAALIFINSHCSAIPPASSSRESFIISAAHGFRSFTPSVLRFLSLSLSLRVEFFFFSFSFCVLLSEAHGGSN
jgi:hypothetical protein